MANALHNNYRNMLGGGGSPTGYVDWNADTIKAHLIDSADAPSPALTMDTESQLTNAGIVATGTLAGVTIGTVATGVIDANDTTLTAVTGDQCELVELWKDTGVDTTSPLLVLFDTFSSGMPVTPNGGNIIIQWNASGILGF